MNFLRQLLVFLSSRIGTSRFRYFFILINALPLFLYFFLDYPAGNIVAYYLLETIIYCLFCILQIRMINIPVITIRITLSMISIGLIVLAIFLIPEWNGDKISADRTEFWNCIAILFSAYTFNYVKNSNTSIKPDATLLKNSVIIKFLVFGMIALSGLLLSRYTKSEITFIIVIVFSKTILDFVMIKAPGQEQYRMYEGREDRSYPGK